METLEEKKDGKQGNKLRGQIIPEDCECQTSFSDCIPRPFNQMLHLNRSQLTKEDPSGQLPCQQHKHLSETSKVIFITSFISKLTKACKYKTARDAFDFVRYTTDG